MQPEIPASASVVHSSTLPCKPHSSCVRYTVAVCQVPSTLHDVNMEKGKAEFSAAACCCGPCDTLDDFQAVMLPQVTCVKKEDAQQMYTFGYMADKAQWFTIWVL
jgi:hypothetical protein